MSSEPAQITGPDPGSGPDRSRYATHSQMSSRDDLADLARRLGAKARDLAARYPTGAGSAGPVPAPAGREPQPPDKDGTVTALFVPRPDAI